MDFCTDKYNKKHPHHNKYSPHERRSNYILNIGKWIRCISPLLKERLEGGKMIYDAGKTQKIVVPNTPFAASVMKDYLAAKWVASWDIYLDTWAVTTVDTCLFEKQQHPNWRSAIFVSQGFHIPRVVYQCHREWVQWVGLVVDRLGIIDRSQYTPWTKLRIRSGRFFREALFDWAAILKIY